MRKRARSAAVAIAPVWNIRGTCHSREAISGERWAQVCFPDRRRRGAGLAAIAALSVIMSVTGCGDKHATAVEPTTTTTTESHSPMACLTAQHLINVTALGGTSWRGDNDYPFYAVFVDRLASPGRAAKVVADAYSTIAYKAGRYAVTGPDLGTEGADRIVSEVARCLRAGR